MALAQLTLTPAHAQLLPTVPVVESRSKLRNGPACWASTDADFDMSLPTWPPELANLLMSSAMAALQTGSSEGACCHLTSGACPQSGCLPGLAHHQEPITYCSLAQAVLAPPFGVFPACLHVKVPLPAPMMLWSSPQPASNTHGVSSKARHGCMHVNLLAELLQSPAVGSADAC